MKKAVLFLFVFSLVLPQSRFDSVLESIRNKPDSAQINSLNNFCWRYKNINPELAIKAAELALQIAEKINDEAGKSKSLGYLSVIFRDAGEYQKSLDLCFSGLEAAHKINDWKQIGYSYNNIATIYRLMGNYPLALETNYKALKIFDEHSDKEGIAFCNYNIGIIYLRQENYKKALENFEQTVSLRKKLNDKDGIAKALSRIAELNMEEGKYPEALTMFNSVESVYNETNDQKSLMNVWMGRAQVYDKLQKYDQALEQSKKALEIANQFKDVEGIVRNTSLIGLMLGKLGKFDEGEKYFNDAQKTSATANSSFLKLNYLENIAKFYELNGDFRNAYKYVILQNSYRDSIERKQKSSMIAEVESAYLTNKKEKEKELLEKDLEHQKSLMVYWLIAFSVLVMVIIIIVFLYNAQRKANEIKDKLFGIIAHDLKNPFGILLTASQMLTDKEWKVTPEEKEEYLTMIATSSKKTYSLLENLLYWSRTQIKGLHLAPRQVELLELTIDTISLANDQAEKKNISLVNKIDPACIVYADEEIVKLVIRNLITNAIKFTEPGGKIIVHGMMEEGRCVVMIEDNGVGIPKEKLVKIFDFNNKKTSHGTKGEKGTGLGLLLCKEFVEKSGGKIWVLSEVGKGTKFFFTLPTVKV